MRGRAVGARVALVSVVVAAVVVSAVAVTARSEPLVVGAATVVRPPLAYVRAGDSLVTVDLDRREVALAANDSVSSLDGALLFRTRPAGPGAELEAFDPRSGVTRWRTPVAPGLEPRVASYDGARVALMAPAAEPAGGYPAGRRTTEVVVAGPGERGRRHQLRGNFEPEAFGLDGRHLYLIKYVPAMAPTGYQVRRLDLGTGRVGPVDSPDIAADTVMGGSARAQVMAPDGRRLYTLYSVPAGVPDGLHGTDHERGRAFIHVLDLEEGWAHCLLLPDPLGVRALANGPLAVSPDGSTLAVLDADLDGGRSSLVSVDTERLQPTEVRRGVGPRWPTSAALGAGGELYVAGGDRVGRPRIEVLDLATGERRRRWSTRTFVTAMSAEAEGSLLLAEPERARVVILRPGGAGGRSVPLPSESGPVAVGPASVTLPGVRDVLECAC